LSPDNANSIVTTLQKLLAHQQSAKAIGSIEEAAAFGAKIQQLLSKHKLSISDLAAKEEEKEGANVGGPIRPRDYGMKVNGNNRFISWIALMAQVIARCNDCEALLLPEVARDIKGKVKKNRAGASYTVTSNSWIFLGVESDRQQVEALFTYMCQLAWDMACETGDSLREQFRQEIIARYGECVPVRLSKRQHNFRHSFCAGFAEAVCTRIKEQRRAMQEEALRNQQALVLVDRRSLLVQSWLQKNTVEDHKAKIAAHKADVDILGVFLGKKAGSAVALTHKTFDE